MEVTTLTIGPMPTNCYVCTDESSGQCAVIDPAYDCKALKDAVCGREIAYILLTHAHADHIMGISAIKQENTKLICHKNEANRLNSSYESLYDYLGLYDRPFEPHRADRFVYDRDVITLGGSEFKVLHTPGHTDGSVCFQSGDIIFSGDTLFSMGVGRMDFPSGSSAMMIKSVKRLFGLKGDLLIYPGHGETTTLDRERTYNPMAEII